MEYLKAKEFTFDSDLLEFVNNTGCKVISITKNGIYFTLFYKNNK